MYDEGHMDTTQSTVCASGVCFAPSCSTGKQRDSESGNDYFGARYYASTMGRFLTPDWSAKAEPVPYAKLDNPQSLNLYAYMLNNPLAGVDADGHQITAKEAKACKDSGSWCVGMSEAFAIAERKWKKDLDIKQIEGSGKARATEAAEAATNFAIAKYKFGAGLEIGSSSETGVGALATAYIAISATGNGAAGVAQSIGAATGWTDEMETGSGAVSAVTSFLGAGTFIVLLCYKRSAPQKGHRQSWRSRERARRMRKVAMECGLWRSGRMRAARPEVRWQMGG